MGDGCRNGGLEARQALFGVMLAVLSISPYAYRLRFVINSKLPRENKALVAGKC